MLLTNAFIFILDVYTFVLQCFLPEYYLCDGIRSINGRNIQLNVIFSGRKKANSHTETIGDKWLVSAAGVASRQTHLDVLDGRDGKCHHDMNVFIMSLAHQETSGSEDCVIFIILHRETIFSDEPM